MFDANTRFAVQIGHAKCSDGEDVPYSNEGFIMSLDGGATFAHVPPTSSAFDPGHTSTSLGVLRGSGN